MVSSWSRLICASDVFAELSLRFRNPVDMIATWDVSPGGRAGAAFAAIGIIIAQIGINISANSIS